MIICTCALLAYILEDYLSTLLPKTISPNSALDLFQSCLLQVVASAIPSISHQLFIFYQIFSFNISFSISPLLPTFFLFKFPCQQPTFCSKWVVHSNVLEISCNGNATEQFIYSSTFAYTSFKKLSEKINLQNTCMEYCLSIHFKYPKRRLCMHVCMCI